MKLFNFLKNYINSNNSLIYNEDFFENQKKDSENGAKTAEKSKEYAVLRRTSVQEGKSNNKKGGLKAFKKSLNKEAQSIENKDYFRKYEAIQKKVTEESAELESVAQRAKSNNKQGFLRAFEQSLNKEAQSIENKDYFRKCETIQEKEKEESAESESVAQRAKSNNKKGFLTAFKQSLTPESTQLFCKNKTQSFENAIKSVKNLLSQPAFRVRPFENKRVRPVETGRSMVEILGVMAIIGVLTVGGISGYRFAMDKYRANDIVNEVSLRNRDTWNMYQTKDLPRVFELEEWTDVTQTGFPIGVYPRSNVMFDVEVNEVPSRICKSVLQLPIQGPLFIWTTIDETRQVKHLYHGNNPEICDIAKETDTDEVSMVFTTTLETYGPEDGIRGELKDERGQPIRYCLEDSDCRACETCYKNDPYTCQSICSDDKPICMQQEGQEARCVECELNIDCPDGHICDERNYTCQPVPKECDPGYFRSKNGACIPCKSPTNVKVSDEKFLQDSLTGAEMCLACNSEALPNDLRHKRNFEVGSNGDLYCSYACTIGVSVQAKSEITLKNPDGTDKVDAEGNPVKSVCRPCWDERTVEVADETEIKKQCSACNQHFWRAPYWPEPFMCSVVREKCAPGTIRRYETTDCIPCEEAAKTPGFFYMERSDKQSVLDQNKETCDACSQALGYVAGERACSFPCIQPEDEEESIRICKNNPRDPNCKRQFAYDNDPRCAPCNAKEVYSVKPTGADPNGYRKQSCLDCGRVVNASGECVLPPTTCPIGQFFSLSADECVPCSDMKGYTVFKDDTTCLNNCKIKSKDADGNITFYGPDDDPEEVAAAESGRWKESWNVIGAPKHALCMLKCPKNYTNGSQVNGLDQGNCMACNGNQNVNFPNQQEKSETAKQFCLDNCPNHYVAYGQLNGCVAGCPTGQFMYRYAQCASCSLASYGDNEYMAGATTEDAIKMCEDCGNRIAANDYGTGIACRLLNPGVSGVCNSLNRFGSSVEDIPESIRSDLKDKMVDYINGDYDGTLFLVDGGKCKSCDDQGSYYSTQAQCESCGNRRFEKNTCIYGLCTEGVTFANTSSTCIDCNTTAPKTEIRSGTDFLCSSCDKKRVMKDADNKSYCVKDCEGNQWQDLSGTCLAYTYNPENETNQEIGTDETSRRLCREAEHIAYSKVEADSKTHWYCSQKPETDKFIDITGALVGCDSGDTEIPDTNDSKNLCLGMNGKGCTTTPRQIETRDGTV